MDAKNMSAADVWAIAAGRLKTQNEHLYRQWFQKLTPLSLEGRMLKLGVSDDFFGSINTD